VHSKTALRYVNVARFRGPHLLAPSDLSVVPPCQPRCVKSHLDPQEEESHHCHVSSALFSMARYALIALLCAVPALGLELTMRVSNGDFFIQHKAVVSSLDGGDSTLGEPLNVRRSLVAVYIMGDRSIRYSSLATAPSRCLRMTAFLILQGYLDCGSMDNSVACRPLTGHVVRQNALAITSVVPRPCI